MSTGSRKSFFLLPPSLSSAPSLRMSNRPGGGQGGGRAEAEVPTATKEDLELVRTVCQIVARQFYQDQHAILIDVLSTHLVMPAETLAKALGLNPREMLQIASLLIRDRLISVYRRSETKESGPSNFVRQSMRNYLYLDRKVFLDVTKWRIMKMRSQIDSHLRNELDNKGYMCPRCGKAFSTLDVAALLDPISMLTFICDVPGCGSELVDNEDAVDVKRSKDRLKRFNEQCGPILDRLRRIDTVALPHFDLMAEIATKGDSDAWIRRALQRKDPNATLNDVAFATGGAKAGPSIQIDMVSTNPELEAQRRLEREAETERKRQENALPEWYKETQDPNAQRGQDEKKTDSSASQGAKNATQNVNSDVAESDDYYARYASMAQEEEAEDDLDLEEVTFNGSASQTATPQTSGSKRSRQGSGEEDDGPHSKRAKEADQDDDGADDDNFDLEEVA